MLSGGIISIHALRVEGDLPAVYDQSLSYYISIHALRVEGDSVLMYACTHMIWIFLSTPSGWRATCKPLCRNYILWISIHALRVEGDRQMDDLILLIAISIHALRVEGDLSPTRTCTLMSHFYPRPPGGGRLLNSVAVDGKRNFYPRPPGGGRPKSRCSSSLHKDFYPRPPGGGRHQRFYEKC